MGSDDLKASVTPSGRHPTRMTAFLFARKKGRNIMTVSILVEDRFGALTAITSFFSARGHNIESLIAVKCRQSGQTRIQLTFECPPSAGEQIVRQLQKLTDVIEAGLEH
jgi:glycine cleavage system regulatory protein